MRFGSFVPRVVGTAVLMGGAGLGFVALGGVGAAAQGCTTQAQMTPAQRAEVGAAAFGIASAVLAGNSSAVQAQTIPQFAGNFDATADLIHTTATAIGGDTLAVRQVYLLDASRPLANNANEASFTCPLAGTAAETDFTIDGLPVGRYAFVMVEASGPHPWLLSLLLEAEPGGWKLAGFYPHTREAAGHNGLWYWATARADAKEDKPWLAWVLYGEADALLRPATFVSTTNLDRLRSERRNAAPAGLAQGLSSDAPLGLAGANGVSYRVTGLGSEASPDARQLNLVMHLSADPLSEEAAATARNVAAGMALLTAHPELRGSFDNLWIIAESPGSNPFVTERPMAAMVGTPK